MIEREGDETWDAFQVDTVIPPVRVGDESYILYGGADFHHDWAFVGKAQGLDTPRRTGRPMN